MGEVATEVFDDELEFDDPPAIDPVTYPTLTAYAAPLLPPVQEIIGRDTEKAQVLASLARPRLSNLMLVGPAGSGKTVLVQETMLADTDRMYLEVDLAKMIADLSNPDEMASRIKTFFDEAEYYSRDEGSELVLFIDEFHQIVQLSAAAVEALKPVLASSGSRGIKVIAATTFEEHHTYIAPNKPLDERLPRIALTPAGEHMTMSILRDMAEQEGVLEQLCGGGLFKEIYDLTNRYIPSSAQPRKSIQVLDAMIGWHRVTGEQMSMALLAKVLRNWTGVNIAFSVDGSTIKERLDERVFAQDMASRVMTSRLQIVVADLHDKSRPSSSFLFTGSTGVGKLCTGQTPVPVFLNNSDHADQVGWKRHDALVVGDQVFDREGNPTEVLGVFSQGQQDIYRVTLWDGRTLDVGGPHLWTVYTAKQRSKKHAGKPVVPLTLSTVEMVERGVVRSYPGDTREHLKFFLPANGAVQWPEAGLAVSPYVMGALIGNGCLRETALTFSSDDEFTVERVADVLGSSAQRLPGNYSWVFSGGSKIRHGCKYVQTKDVLGAIPDLIGCYSDDRRIPAQYLRGSVAQRWELVRGLFDTDGTIDPTTGRFNISYSTSSKGLAEDVRQLLFSLGVSNTLNAWERTKVDEAGVSRDMVEYDMHVKIGNEDKAQFFALPRKRELAERAALATAGRTRVKKFDMVGISSIEKLGEQQEATCIYVDNDEHLYQAGQFVVTHNTEMTKALVDLLFGDDVNRLIRFDMSEFALPESLNLFRSEMTRQVANMGHAVILLDEIEKANPIVLRLLLQVLDDGRLTDDNGRQVSFLNTYIILTTNAGSEVFNTINTYAADDTGSGAEIADFVKSIHNSLKTAAGFPPELLGRLDAIVPFQPLSEGTKRRIIDRGLRKLREEVMSKHGVTLRINRKVLQYLSQDIVDDDAEAGGARGALRVLSDEVTTEVARVINENPLEKTLILHMDGDLRSDNKMQLKTHATPKVSVPQ